MSTPDTGVAPAPDEQLERVERRLTRARDKIAILEGMIEDKTRSLYMAQEEISAKSHFLESILRSMDSAVFVTDSDARIVAIDGAMSTNLGGDPSAFLGEGLGSILTLEGDHAGGAAALDTLAGLLDCGGEATLATSTGALPVLLTASALSSGEDEITGAVCVATDMSERKRLEIELRHAQKLESVGQLAAGVAHEINTPIQYIGDSVHFLGDVVTDLLGVCDIYGSLRDAARGSEALASAVAAVEAAEEDADLDFVASEAPAALTRTLDGVQRVATIVKAMKQFSHPGSDQHAPEDLNELVDTTLVVAMNEYKYAADIAFDRGDIPQVMCNRGDISQVLLNLLVNAAHAIGDKIEGTPDRGTITITSTKEADGVCLSITDTGMGIPEHIKDRVFDPFFTTKAPGKGTGQGLAISHSVVVDGHDGRLTVESVEGEGTTFRVWLPGAAAP